MNNVAEIKIRCERRIGEFSQQLPKEKGNQYATSHHGEKQTKTSILKSAGIKHHERYESIAKLPEKEFEGCVQFWIGDCLKYREQKWGMYEDVAEESGLDKQTLKDIKYVSDKVESSLRKENLGFHHHLAVAPLAPEKQEEYLQKAVDEKLTVRSLNQNRSCLYGHPSAFKGHSRKASK